MYWLIASLIIVVMMGVLAIGDTMAMPVSPLLMEINPPFILPLLLTILTLILIITTQRYIPFSPTFSSKRSISQNTSAQDIFSQPYFVQNPDKPLSNAFALLGKMTHFLILAVLALTLIAGSGLIALISQQQAENSKIKQPLRVQALVSIEGISDSVYDVAGDSGYRQVAIISHVSPLVANLDSKDLDNQTADHSRAFNNSLSKNSSENDSYANKQYRVLLNAYPKKPAKASRKKSSISNLKKKAKKISERSQQTIDFNSLRPGDQLLMTLTLSPLTSSEQAINNPTGFDSYKWLRGRHIDGIANIITTSSSVIAFDKAAAVKANNNLYRLQTVIDQKRWQIRQYFYQDWASKSLATQQAKAVTLSLLTGDRSLINRDTKDLYQLAGISHLLAISGTHVLFLAIVLAGLAVLVFNRFYPALYRHIPRWQLRWWVMMSAAFIYALFTGFDVPAARTAWMLLAIGLVRLTLLPIHSMRILLALAVLMAWLDPYVLWQAGYWLSFIAVALLLKYEDTSVKPTQLGSVELSLIPSFHLHGDSNRRLIKQIWIGFKRLFRLQCWLFIALLPVTLLLFGKASLLGLAVNLFAIGLFGWIIVPLNLLAGLCYLISPALADVIWTLVINIVAYLHELIAWLTSLPALSDVWLYTPINIAILLMVTLAMSPWLLPRGLISRWLALPPLTLLVMTVFANQQSLTMSPTLYILPTKDQYISAVLLQYPVMNDDNNKSAAKSLKNKNSNWLFLADHRAQDDRTMPTTLAADKFSTVLEQQLRSLSVKRLEGIVVQSSSAALTNKTLTNKLLTQSASIKSIPPNQSELLPMTVAQLIQRFPTAQYWQAGQSERWSEIKHAYQIINQPKTPVTISAQRCEQGKSWQLATGELTLQALTGWSKINDASVWDCTVAIDSRIPIQVVRYNAADPLKAKPANVQILQSSSQPPTHLAKDTQSRLIVDADTHQRLWQMWSLLCSANPSAQNNYLNKAITRTTWLGHSTSRISTDAIRQQQIQEIITYDNKLLEAAPDKPIR